MRREPVFDVLSGIAQTINKIQGLRIDIVGQQNLPRVGGGVLAVNHTSYVDFIEVGLVGRRSKRYVRYMMKKSLEENGFLRRGDSVSAFSSSTPPARRCPAKRNPRRSWDVRCTHRQNWPCSSYQTRLGRDWY